jgi:glycerophosphoryl diester phosphodiesterase
VENDVLIIGHRGCRGLRIENTLTSFKHALDMGVDGIELDTHLTKDGQVVVHHDYKLNPDLTRTAAGIWLKKTGRSIDAMTFEEIRSYKLGKIHPSSSYRHTFPDVKETEDEQIPSLKDVLNLAKGYPKARILIEMKTMRHATPALDVVLHSHAVLDAILESGLKSRCAVLAFDVRVLKHINQMDPSLSCFLNFIDINRSNSSYSKVVTARWFQILDKHYNISGPMIAHTLGAKSWSSLYNQLSPDNIKQAQDLGLKIMAWTVNTIEDAKKLINWGIHIIATDRPDLLLRGLNRKQKSLPDETLL